MPRAVAWASRPLSPERPAPRQESAGKMPTPQRARRPRYFPARALLLATDH